MSVRRSAVRRLAQLGGGLHILLYRTSGGRIGGRIQGLDVLLLTTTGRRSGKLRTAPLCYLPDGDDLVVVASNGGMAWYPAWWLNLMSTPRATVEIGRIHRSITAREASAEERQRLWAEITARIPSYLKYEQRTTRPIPLGILEPR
ncbi:MAG TPA: nitroreductase/quinone reductase family protein [Gaiellaceae bacterium]